MHPGTIIAMENLAFIKHELGLHDETQELRAKFLELKREVLGLHHPDTIQTMANLASTWIEMGRVADAENV